MNAQSPSCDVARRRAARPAAAPSCRARQAARSCGRSSSSYTSEGCDSCPPADRWFSATFGGRAPAGPFALAFHVDYWDRLGWKDRFAERRYTERQQPRPTRIMPSFVYTPQVLLQGRDSRWRDARAADRVGAQPRQPARVSIDARRARGRRALRVRATARAAGNDARLPPDASVALAYVDSDLNSEVKAGENRGVRLHHDHVVRALHRRRPDGREGVAAEATVRGSARRRAAIRRSSRSCSVAGTARSCRPSPCR